MPGTHICESVHITSQACISLNFYNNMSKLILSNSQLENSARISPSELASQIHP